MNILLVDDDPGVRGGIGRFLSAAGWSPVLAETAAEALAVAQSTPVDLVLLDLRLPDGSGLDVLPGLRRALPDAPIIVLTGDEKIESAVQAMKIGADHYMTKPPHLEELKLRITDLLGQRAVRREATFYRTRKTGRLILGESAAARALRTTVRMVAESEGTTVLIAGESGTGKELVAREVHQLGSRSQRAFVDVNCAALSPTLLESELFGYERGAFTGAAAQKIGLLEIAEGGVLFLDEIGEMDLAIQAKFLRVLETRRFRRVGGVKDLAANFRVVAATNRDLAEFVAQGRFREDLYFRLNVFPINVPPLRERADDVPLLAELFAQGFGRAADPAASRITPEALALLKDYAWPGNVRELRNVIERAGILSRGGPIRAEHLPPEMTPRPGASARVSPENQTLEAAERSHIRNILAQEGGNVTQTAKVLDISRSTLQLKIQKYGLES